VRGLLDRLGFKQAQSAGLRRVPNYAGGGLTEIDKSKEIRQGQILANIKYYFWEENKDDPRLADASSYQLSYAIVATPDCDLLQDFKARRSGLPGILFSILLFGAELPDRAKERTGLGKREWKPVLQNQIDQYHYLDCRGMITENLEDLADGLIVDFKRYFTLTAQELYRQFTASDAASRCNRICRLSDLWREDFQRRAMSFMQRVALPDPSDDEQR
jgi:hypothetical protein